MSKTHFVNLLAFASMASILSPQMASAQTCSATNATLNGAYGFIATLTGSSSTSASSGTTTGGSNTTPTTSATYSSTPLGQLLNALSKGTPFSSTGRVAFDGSGNVYAAQAAQGGAQNVVGTYTVAGDCSVTVTLIDAFGSNPAGTVFHGIVLNGGNELDLVPANNQSTLVRMLKLLAPIGCTTLNLTGPYGLVALGTQTQTSVPNTGGAATGTGSVSATATITAFLLVGSGRFDGAGNVTVNPGGLSPSPSPSSLQLTGSYIVNSDCSGTMTLSQGSGSTTPTPVAVNFVLTQPVVVAGPSGSSNGGNSRPGLAFGISAVGVVAYGAGQPQ